MPKRRVSEYNRREDMEQFLISKGISFMYKEDVRTTLFDVEKSLRNQVRLGNPLSETTVRQYHEALLSGDIFPPLLAEKVGEKYVALDGNHRLKASIDAGEPVDVYICQGTPQQLVQLSFLANAKHGLPNSVEDRLHHALFMVDNGLSQIEASRLLNVPRKDLAKAVLKQQAGRRADDAGVLRTDWEAIPQTVRMRMLSIHTDEGFRAAVALVLKAGLSTDEASKMVARMNQTRNASRQVGVVNALKSEYAERIVEVQVSGSNKPGGKRTVSPRTRLAFALGAVVTLPPPQTFNSMDIPDDMRKDLAERVEEAITYLTELRESFA